MLLFCPVCSNSLTISRTHGHSEIPDGKNRMECRTCSYHYILNQRLYERKDMKKKEVDDVMGGKEAWSNVDHTAIQCTKEGCNGTRAFFYQLQIRSADEPMSTFYKCTTCGHRWREQ